MLTVLVTVVASPITTYASTPPNSFGSQSCNGIHFNPQTPTGRATNIGLPHTDQPIHFNPEVVATQGTGFPMIIAPTASLSFTGNNGFAEGERIGVLTIQRHNRSINVYEGETMRNMDFGAGRFTFSGANSGNTALIGHNRGRSNGFFSFVRTLQEGDTIALDMNGITRNYAITHSFIVHETDFTPLMEFGVVSLIINDSPELPQQRELFTLQDYSNVTVVVVFDQEPPIIQFIAPDGSLIDMVNLRYRPGSNFTQFFFPNSMPGVWQMTYHPLSNTDISSPYFIYTDHIMIMDFEAQMLIDEAGNIPVSFRVSSDEQGDFTYNLYAIFTAPDNSIEHEILLIQGEEFLNNRVDLSVNISDIRDKGGFMLRLTAYKYGEYDQSTIEDTAWFDLRIG